ncbi:MAG: T9SS type A sorting domain-containing protein [Lewinellaceae bacterium]|nr:T9SS type A sorting domain-containing protein [Lewinellaceae bacterium]
MKKLTISALLCALTICLSAQIQLEHTYEGLALKRIRMDVSGEKYLLKQYPCHLFLSHADHTPFGEANLLSGYGGCIEVLVSEHLLDSDDDFEILFNWLDDGTWLDTGTSVWNDGEEQQISSDGPTLVLSEFPGLQTKLLIGAKVQALPGPVPEHHYGTYNRLERKVFPVDGERYVTYNWKNFDGFHFYNGDHELVKSVNLPLSRFDKLDLVTQQYFNDDAQYEFFGTRPADAAVDGNSSVAELVREDGAVLFSTPCNHAYISALPGLPDRLIVNGYSVPDVKLQKIYDAHSLVLLHTFPFYTERIAADSLTGYYVRYSPQKDSLWLYDDDFLQVKTIPTMTGANWGFGFTRNRFADNGKLEIFFTTKNGPGLNDTKVVCIDEDGALLYAFPEAKSARVDQQPGMDDKFFVSYRDSIQVYDFTLQSTGVAEVSTAQHIEVFPNPFGTAFEIKFAKAGDYTIRLTNTSGQLVQSEYVENAARAMIQTGRLLPPGVYFCTVTGAGVQQTLRMIKYE